MTHPPWGADITLLARRELHQALEEVQRGGLDAAVLVAGAGRAAEEAARICEQLERASGEEPLPVLLAGSSADPEMARALGAADFDGFLDLAWTPPMIAQALRSAISGVRSGRGIVAIQHQVLSAVRLELSALKELSLRDELTGLFNYRYFREVLAREHLRCSRHRRPYAIACFDVDNLRELNNQFGHAVGSRGLERVGWAMASNTRKSDYAFRVGGDEFVALLVESAHEGGMSYARRLKDALRREVLVEDEPELNVSISAGVAAFPADGTTAEEVLHRADEALYRAKQTGRSRIVQWGEVA